MRKGDVILALDTSVLDRQIKLLKESLAAIERSGTSAGALRAQERKRLLAAKARRNAAKVFAPVRGKVLEVLVAQGASIDKGEIPSYVGSGEVI